MLKKITSLVTIFCFLGSQLAEALPVGGVTAAPEREMPSFLQIEVPEDLATIQDIFEAPPRPDPRVVLHVQTAHGNYEAQTKIAKLLEYFYQKYSIKLLFLEGASSELDPDLVKLFEDNQRNQELAKALTEKGVLTGAEYYLTQAPEDVRAIGIERPELYREDLEAFRAVHQAAGLSEKFLKQMEMRLNRQASKILSPEARQVLSEWKKFEQGRRDFLPYVQKLAKTAKKVLNLDLKSLFSQVEWPELTRVLVLESMSKELQPDQAQAEKKKLVEFLKRVRISQGLIREIEEFGDSGIKVYRLEGKSVPVTAEHTSGDRLQQPVPSGVHRVPGPEQSPRFILERLFEEAGPRGFRFQDYPAFSLYAGHEILKNEVTPRRLYQEIETLFTEILEKLVPEESGKNLLALNRDFELLKRLFHLELTRDDWQKVQERREDLNPKAMVRRMKKGHRKNPESRNRNPVKSVLGTAEHASGDRLQQPVPKKGTVPFGSRIFTTACEFYRLAQAREKAFYETLDREMTERKTDKAILVTGGFHTDGLKELFQEEEINYGILMPRITTPSDEKTYLNTMLGKTRTAFDLAHIEQVLMMMRNELREMFGASSFEEVKIILESHLEILLSTPGLTPQDIARAMTYLGGSKFFRDRGHQITVPGTLRAGFFEPGTAVPGTVLRTMPARLFFGGDYGLSLSGSETYRITFTPTADGTFGYKIDRAARQEGRMEVEKQPLRDSPWVRNFLQSDKFIPDKVREACVFANWSNFLALGLKGPLDEQVKLGRLSRQSADEILESVLYQVPLPFQNSLVDEMKQKLFPEWLNALPEDPWHFSLKDRESGETVFLNEKFSDTDLILTRPNGRGQFTLEILTSGKRYQFQYDLNASDAWRKLFPLIQLVRVMEGFMGPMSLKDILKFVWMMIAESGISWDLEGVIALLVKAYLSKYSAKPIQDQLKIFVRRNRGLLIEKEEVRNPAYKLEESRKEERGMVLLPENQRLLDLLLSKYSSFSAMDFLMDPPLAKKGEYLNTFENTRRTAEVLQNRNWFMRGKSEDEILAQLKTRLGYLKPGIINRVKDQVIEKMRQEGVELRREDILTVASFGSFWHATDMRKISDVDFVVVVKNSGIRKQFLDVPIEHDQWFSEQYPYGTKLADFVVVSEDFYLNRKYDNLSQKNNQVFDEVVFWGSLVPLEGYDFWYQKPNVYNLVKAVQQMAVKAMSSIRHPIFEESLRKFGRRWRELHQIFLTLISPQYLGLSESDPVVEDLQKANEESERLESLADMTEQIFYGKVEAMLKQTASITGYGSVEDGMIELLKKHLFENQAFYAQMPREEKRSEEHVTIPGTGTAVPGIVSWGDRIHHFIANREWENHPWYQALKKLWTPVVQKEAEQPEVGFQNLRFKEMSQLLDKIHSEEVKNIPDSRGGLQSLLDAHEALKRWGMTGVILGPMARTSEQSLPNQKKLSVAVLSFEKPVSGIHPDVEWLFPEQGRDGIVVWENQKNETVNLPLHFDPEAMAQEQIGTGLYYASPEIMAALDENKVIARMNLDEEAPLAPEMRERFRVSISGDYPAPGFWQFQIPVNTSALQVYDTTHPAVRGIFHASSAPRMETRVLTDSRPSRVLNTRRLTPEGRELSEKTGIPPDKISEILDGLAAGFQPSERTSLQGVFHNPHTPVSWRNTTDGSGEQKLRGRKEVRSKLKTQAENYQFTVSVNTTLAALAPELLLHAGFALPEGVPADNFFDQWLQDGVWINRNGKKEFFPKDPELDLTRLQPGEKVEYSFFPAAPFRSEERPADAISHQVLEWCKKAVGSNDVFGNTSLLAKLLYPEIKQEVKELAMQLMLLDPEDRREFVRWLREDLKQNSTALYLEKFVYPHISKRAFRLVLEGLVPPRIEWGPELKQLEESLAGLKVVLYPVLDDGDALFNLLNIILEGQMPVEMMQSEPRSEKVYVVLKGLPEDLQNIRQGVDRSWHEAYLVPDKKCKDYLLNSIEEAKWRGLAPNWIHESAKKIFTYQEYASQFLQESIDEKAGTDSASDDFPQLISEIYHSGNTHDASALLAMLVKEKMGGRSFQAAAGQTYTMRTKDLMPGFYLEHQGRMLDPETEAFFKLTAPSMEFFQHYTRPGYGGLVLEDGRRLGLEYQNKGIARAYTEVLREVFREIRSRLPVDPVLTARIIHLPTLLLLATTLPREWCKNKDEWPTVMKLQFETPERLNHPLTGIERPLSEFPEEWRDLKTLQFKLRDMLVEYFSSQVWENASPEERGEVSDVLRGSSLVQGYLKGFEIQDFDFVPEILDGQKSLRLFFRIQEPKQMTGYEGPSRSETRLLSPGHDASWTLDPEKTEILGREIQKRLSKSWRGRVREIVQDELLFYFTVVMGPEGNFEDRLKSVELLVPGVLPLNFATMFRVGWRHCRNAARFQYEEYMEGYQGDVGKEHWRKVISRIMKAFFWSLAFIEFMSTGYEILGQYSSVPGKPLVWLQLRGLQTPLVNTLHHELAHAMGVISGAEAYAYLRMEDLHQGAFPGDWLVTGLGFFAHGLSQLVFWGIIWYVGAPVFWGGVLALLALVFSGRRVHQRINFFKATRYPEPVKDPAYQKAMASAVALWDRLAFQFDPVKTPEDRIWRWAWMPQIDEQNIQKSHARGNLWKQYGMKACFKKVQEVFGLFDSQKPEMFWSYQEAWELAAFASGYQKARKLPRIAAYEILRYHLIEKMPLKTAALLVEDRFSRWKWEVPFSQMFEPSRVPDTDHGGDSFIPFVFEPFPVELTHLFKGARSVLDSRNEIRSSGVSLEPVLPAADSKRYPVLESTQLKTTLLLGGVSNTLKDILRSGHGLRFKENYVMVLPPVLFNGMRSFGEIEFLTYYNAFLLGNLFKPHGARIRIVGTREQTQALTELLSHTLLGPDWEQGAYLKNVSPEERKLLITLREHYRIRKPDGSAIPVEEFIETIPFDKQGRAVIQVKNDAGEMTGSLEVKPRRDAAREVVEYEVTEEHAGEKKNLGVLPIEYDLPQPRRYPVPEGAAEAILKARNGFSRTWVGTSAGFDPNGDTTSLILWLEGKGIWVDPSYEALEYMDELGISEADVPYIFLSHIHGDHDGGVLRRILMGRKVKLIASNVVYGEVLKKAGLMLKFLGIRGDMVKELIDWTELSPGKPLELPLAGGRMAKLETWWNLHPIPANGLSVEYDGFRYAHSGDTQWDAGLFEKMIQAGKLTPQQAGEYQYRFWDASGHLKYDFLDHESGVPPIHTDVKALANLPAATRGKMNVYHLPDKDVTPDLGLKKAVMFETQTFKAADLQTQKQAEREILKSSVLLSGKNPDFFDRLEVMAVPQSIPEGTAVMTQGEKGDAMYFILGGKAGIYVDGEKAAVLGSGDSFGEWALVTGEPRSATVVAESPLRVYRIDSGDFQKLFDQGTVLDWVRKVRHSIKLLQAWVRQSTFQGFGAVPQAVMDVMASGAVERSYQQGEEIIRQGEIGDEFFIILDGSVEVIQSREGQQAVLKRLAAGDFFGEVAILKNGIRTATVRTMTPVTVMVLSGSAFRNLLDQYPGIRIGMAQAVKERSEIRPETEEDFSEGLEGMDYLNAAFDEILPNAFSAALLGEGEPQVWVQIEKVQDGTEILFRDSGPGFDPEQLRGAASVFYEHYQKFDGDVSLDLTPEWQHSVRRLAAEGSKDWKDFHDFLFLMPAIVSMTAKKPLDRASDVKIIESRSPSHPPLYVTLDYGHALGGRGRLVIQEFIVNNLKGKIQTANCPEPGVGFEMRILIPASSGDAAAGFSDLESIARLIDSKVQELASDNGPKIKFTIDIPRLKKRFEVRTEKQNLKRRKFLKTLAGAGAAAMLPKVVTASISNVSDVSVTLPTGQETFQMDLSQDQGAVTANGVRVGTFTKKAFQDTTGLGTARGYFVIRFEGDSIAKYSDKAWGESLVFGLVDASNQVIFSDTAAVSDFTYEAADGSTIFVQGDGVMNQKKRSPETGFGVEEYGVIAARVTADPLDASYHPAFLSRLKGEEKSFRLSATPGVRDLFFESLKRLLSEAVPAETRTFMIQRYFSSAGDFMALAYANGWMDSETLNELRTLYESYFGSFIAAQAGDYVVYGRYLKLLGLPGISYGTNQNILQKCLASIHRTWHVTLFNELGQVMLDRSLPLAENDPLRTLIIDTWFEALNDPVIKAHLVPGYRENFMAASLAVGDNPEQEKKIMDFLGLNEDQRVIFHDYRVLVLKDSTYGSFTDEEISKIREWMGMFPAKMLRRIGVVRNVKEGMDSGSNMMGLTDHAAFINVRWVTRWVFDHETFHAIDLLGDFLTRPDWLPENREVRLKLFSEALLEGLLVSDQAKIDEKENATEEWAAGVKVDTLGRLEKLIDAAMREKKFASLRIYMSILEILLYHSDQPGRFPLYKVEGNLVEDTGQVVGYLDAAANEHHNITSITLPEDRKVEFEYDKDFLRLKSISVDGVSFSNPKADASTGIADWTRYELRAENRVLGPRVLPDFSRQDFMNELKAFMPRGENRVPSLAEQRSAVERGTGISLDQYLKNDASLTARDWAALHLAIAVMPWVGKKEVSLRADFEETFTPPYALRASDPNEVIKKWLTNNKGLKAAEAFEKEFRERRTVYRKKVEAGIATEEDFTQYYDAFAGVLNQELFQAIADSYEMNPNILTALQVIQKTTSAEDIEIEIIGRGFAQPFEYYFKRAEIADALGRVGVDASKVRVRANRLVLEDGVFKGKIETPMVVDKGKWIAPEDVFLADATDARLGEEGLVPKFTDVNWFAPDAKPEAVTRRLIDPFLQTMRQESRPLSEEVDRWALALAILNHGGPLNIAGYGTKFLAVSLTMEKMIKSGVWEEEGWQAKQVSESIAKLNPCAQIMWQLSTRMKEIEHQFDLEKQIPQEKLSNLKQAYFEWLESFEKMIPEMVRALNLMTQDIHLGLETPEHSLKNQNPEFWDMFLADADDLRRLSDRMLMNLGMVHAFLADDASGWLELYHLEDWLRGRKWDTKQGTAVVIENLDKGPFPVRIHPLLLHLSLERVISNGFRVAGEAFMGNHEAAIHLRIEKGKTPGGRSTVRIVIENPGRVPDEKLKTIFKLNPNRKYFDRNIGLPFTAMAIRKMGGEITMENVVVDGQEIVRTVIEFPEAEEPSVDKIQIASDGRLQDVQDAFLTQKSIQEGTVHREEMRAELHTIAETMEISLLPELGKVNWDKIWDGLKDPAQVVSAVARGFVAKGLSLQGTVPVLTTFARAVISAVQQMTQAGVQVISNEGEFQEARARLGIRMDAPEQGIIVLPEAFNMGVLPALNEVYPLSQKLVMVPNETLLQGAETFVSQHGLVNIKLILVPEPAQVEQVLMDFELSQKTALHFSALTGLNESEELVNALKLCKKISDMILLTSQRFETFLARTNETVRSLVQQFVQEAVVGQSA